MVRGSDSLSIEKQRMKNKPVEVIKIARGGVWVKDNIHPRITVTAVMNYGVFRGESPFLKRFVCAACGRWISLKKKPLVLREYTPALVFLHADGSCEKKWYSPKMQECLLSWEKGHD